VFRVTISPLMILAGDPSSFGNLPVKRIMRIIVFTLCIFFCLQACNQPAPVSIRITGEAQGTTYAITYLSANNDSYKEEVDSILKAIDLSLSTYVPQSLISRINQNQNGVVVDHHFKEVFNKAKEVSTLTGGVFDVTVAPLINAYGFGFTKRARVDSMMVDSLLRLVGYQGVQLEGSRLVKSDPRIMLDFNAIAQGYTVDVLSGYLESRGISSYLVELGGEVRTKGKKSNEQDWKIGIDQPSEDFGEERPLKAIVRLRDKALATSGNYRKFYLEDGRKYAHIIDPHTGYPAKHHLLSATVIANNCMTADAYATAFMVMGVEKARQFLSLHKDLGLEVYFIYDEQGVWKTYMSESLKQWVEDLP
jgi:thiamine biosynthesis lipoprotein